MNILKYKEKNTESIPPPQKASISFTNRNESLAQQSLFLKGNPYGEQDA